MIADTAADAVNIDDEPQAGFSVHGYVEDLTPYVEADAESLRITEFLRTSIESFMSAAQHRHNLADDT
jgi:hypothetical protein